ncbi:MAG: FixH family protein [gamma proteobacterium symbiont of Bathyaustriella thionipta]|nr:FixH family protein [gamma proteobacterium symbiont of Bathyaustriella thionipta]
MAHTEQLDTEPWYRQFWPWFLIFFPAAAVVAGIATLIIAIKTDDGLVTDNYYKKGLAINKDIHLQQKAETLGIAATLDKTDNEHLRVHLTLNGNQSRPGHLSVILTHPTLGEQDRQLTLLPLPDSSDYIALIGEHIAANWHVHIYPPDHQWTIQTRHYF